MNYKHRPRSATSKQLAYMRTLAAQVAPNVDLIVTLKRHGMSDEALHAGLSMFQASLLIVSLQRALPARAERMRDPGEDAAERWSESQVGL